MLSAASRPVVEATLPVVREHITQITREFYASMFAAHPELLNLFNRGNQANGDQQQALAGSVIAYAEHLLGEDRVPFGEVVARIASKHASLGVRPEQYTVVGTHLLGAVGTVLGGAVTPQIAAAWDEVYWLFAVRLLAAETRLYQQSGSGPDTALRVHDVVGRTVEAEDTVSLLLAPAAGAVPQFRPGQYVSVEVRLPDGGRQIRQYSLSRAPGGTALRITVRRVHGLLGRPDGLVSTHLTRETRVGDQLRVSLPFGDLALADDASPLILASAGIGITPIAAIVEHVARTEPGRAVVAAHAEKSPQRHALSEHVRRSSAELHDYRGLTYYSNYSDATRSTDDEASPSASASASGQNTVRVGRLDPDLLPVIDGARAYLCGPVSFMRDVRRSLVERGVPVDRIHYEVFGPDLWTTGADTLPQAPDAVPA